MTACAISKAGFVSSPQAQGGLLMLTSLRFGLIILALAMSLEAGAQVTTSPFGRQTQGTLGPADAEQRAEELEQQRNTAASRMGLKTCIDQLSLQYEDDLLEQAANLVRARYASHPWTRLTNYYMGAGLKALYHLEQVMSQVAAETEPTCFFYPKDAESSPSPTPTNPFNPQGTGPFLPGQTESPFESVQ